jgi:hypothetical protein
MNFAPIIRIVLRYVVGAGLMGSHQIGDILAADPDLVLMISAGIGIAVESGYAIARRKGWAT